MSQSISDSQFETEVLKSPLPVLIDFWAPWCGPCKAMNPILEELSAEYEGKLKIIKMNVDENMDVPGQFNIMSIPTFMIFKGGHAVGSVIGARPKADMKREIDKALAA